MPQVQQAQQPLSQGLTSATHSCNFNYNGINFTLTHGDLYSQNVDAIVSAVYFDHQAESEINPTTLQLGGESIAREFQALPDLALGFRMLYNWRPVRTGSGSLGANGFRNHVIHTVIPHIETNGLDIFIPRVRDSAIVGYRPNLMATYRAVLEKAREVGARSIALPWFVDMIPDLQIPSDINLFARLNFFQALMIELSEENSTLTDIRLVFVNREQYANACTQMNTHD
jgi:hypothetical protein